MSGCRVLRGTGLLLWVVVGGLLLSGCGPKIPRPGADQLLVVVPGEGDAAKIWEEALESYEQEHHQRTYLHCLPPDDYADQLAKLLARGVKPDLVWVESTQLLELVTQNKLASLNEQLATSTTITPDDYFPQAWAAFNYQGQQYALPNGLSILAMVRNIGRFEVAFMQRPESDWNWDDYVKAARQLTEVSDVDGRISTYGTIACPWWQVYVWQNGGDLVDNPTRPTRSTLSTPEAREGLQFIADLILREKVAPPPELVRGTGRLALFKSGRAAIMCCSVQETHYFGRLREFMWEYISLPRGKKTANLGLAQGFAITQGARNPAAAWQLITHLTTVAGQTSIGAGSYFTPAKEVMANSASLSQMMSITDPFREGIEVARPLPATPVYRELAQLYETELAKLWSGQMDVNEVTRRLDEQVDRLLKQTPSPTAWLQPLNFTPNPG
jgi:multiple sugar transport system substrate-binding protein